jgi:hypothetical protein
MVQIFCQTQGSRTNSILTCVLENAEELFSCVVSNGNNYCQIVKPHQVKMERIR